MMVYNDEVADYYMEFLEERGLHVPEDISLVSFDDAELQDSSTSIQLVTAVHPKYQLGRITAKHLLRMMEDPEWQQKNYSYRFPVKIRDGNSVTENIERSEKQVTEIRKDCHLHFQYKILSIIVKKVKNISDST